MSDAQPRSKFFFRHFSQTDFCDNKQESLISRWDWIICERLYERYKVQRWSHRRDEQRAHVCMCMCVFRTGKVAKGFVNAVVVASVISSDNTRRSWGCFFHWNRARGWAGRTLIESRKSPGENLVPTHFYLAGLPSILIQSAARSRKKLRRRINLAAAREKLVLENFSSFLQRALYHNAWSITFPCVINLFLHPLIWSSMEPAIYCTRYHIQ